jgi:serine/threonine-protein kinase
MPHPSHQVTIETFPGTFAQFLGELGTVFRTFDEQDSGNVAYGVRAEGRLLWVKHARAPHIVECMKNAVRFYNEVRHPLIPRLLRAVALTDGFVHVSEWVRGELAHAAAADRHDPSCAHYRFVHLPLRKRIDAFAAILDLFCSIESHGYIVEDFYDGCILYDFATQRIHICDLDHAHPGPYVLERERNFGSRRYMAPEEFQRGALIDHRTNVFTMGATALVLFGNTVRDRARWQAPLKLWPVVARATEPQPADRFTSIAEMREAWQEARGLGTAKA